MKGLQRIISGMLAVCLLVSMLPVSAWATETESVTETVPETTVAETQKPTAAETPRAAVFETQESSSEETTETESVPEATAAIEMIPAVTVLGETTPESITSETVEAEETVTEEASTPLVVSAITTGGTCGDNLTWTLDDAGVLTVSGHGKMTEFNTALLAPWHNYKADITSVIIQDGVETIEYNAFSFCDNLSSVSIPSSVDIIGDYAFYSCKNLQSVSIMHGVSEIGKYSFASCYNLTEITLPSSISKIDSYAFQFSESIENISLPSNLEYLGEYAFRGCTNIKTITVPSSLENIPERAFYDCSILERVVIQEGVIQIGRNAFDGCKNLKSIELPLGLTYIGDQAFWHCNNLADIDIPDTITYIGQYAFSECEKLKSITIPDGIVTIDDGTFSGCSGLVSVNIPQSVQFIGASAFSHCNMISEITILSEITEIESYAFGYSESLHTIRFNGGAPQVINDFIFDECNNLNSLYFSGNAPETVSSIAFYGITASAYYPADNTTWTSDVMQNYGGDITWIPYTPDTSDDMIINSGSCGDLLTWTLDNAGVLTIRGSGAMYDYYPGDDEHWLSDHVSPELVTSVVFDGNITHLGAYAFSGTSIVDLTIPASITSMDVTALYGIDTLSGIWVEEGNPNFTNDEFGVLYDINKIALIKMPNRFDGEYTIPSGVTIIFEESFYSCPNLTKVTIPDGVETIENGTFSGCSKLREIVVPDSITSIGFAAFNDCSSLETVYYTGTKEEWAAIDINDGENDELHAATIYYNYSPVELSGWQKAYYDFIVADKASSDFDWDYVTYELVYLNDDTIPELWIDYGYSYAGTRIMSYYRDQLVTTSLSSGTLTYEEKNNRFYHSWGHMGQFSDTVYQLTDEGLTKVATGTYHMYDQDGNLTDHVVAWNWNGLDVSEEWYYKYLYDWVDPDIALKTGVNESMIFDYDSILEYLLSAETEEPNKAENGLVIFSDYTSLSVSVGYTLTLSAGILVDGNRLSDVSGITFQITDTSILKAEGTGIYNNSRYLELKGLKVGQTTVVISDSATGYKAKVPITVYKKNVHSYSLSDIPEKYIEKYPTNFYNINGLYIDSYEYSINSDQTANVSFDVYNTNYAYGAVEVYDQHGNMTDAVLIKKMTSNATSVKKALLDNIGYIIRDIREGDLFTYRQESGYTKQTHVEIKNIPQNGYIRIWTDPQNSFVVGFINAVDMLMSMSSLSGDIKNYDAYSNAFTEELTVDLVANDIYATLLKDGSNLPQKFWKSVGKQTFITSESMGDFTNSIANNIDSFDLGKLLSSTAESFGWSIGTKIFTHFTGPIGEALNIFFIIGKATDTITQFADLAQAENSGSIYIHNQGGGIRASQQIMVESETDFPNETSLNVFTVELDNVALDILKATSPEVYEAFTEGVTYTYNISLLENGKEVQPGDVVTVYIPVPEDLKLLAHLNMVSVYRMEEDGTMTKLDAKFKDGCLVFTTDHFSLYSIVGYDPTSTPHEHRFSDNVCEICGITGGTCGENLSWALYEEGVLSITGSGEMYDFERDEIPWYEYRDQITEILLPDGLTRIGDDAFRGLYKVQNVTIPEGVTEIGSCSFIMTGLTSVSLPESLLTIGSSAFDSARLKSIDIPDSVTLIGSSAFGNCHMEHVFIPASVETIGGGAFSHCYNLKSISVDPNNAHFLTDTHGVLYSSDMTTLYQCPALYSGEYVIPNGVSTLQAQAFDGCEKLTKVTIPDSVTSLPGQSTFSHCSSLTQLILPDGITSIGYAFAFYCTNLKTVSLPDQLKYMGYHSFYRCSNLTRIIIPESVTEISRGCFEESALRSIIFRGSAPAIDETAFTDITATAYYPGNDATWTADTMLNYGGNITWVPVYENETVTRIDAKKTILNAGETLDLTAVLDPGVLVDEEIIWTLYDDGNGGGTELMTENGTTAQLYAGYYLYDNVITVTAQAADSSAEPAVLEITIRERDADYTLFAGKSLTLKETDPATGKPYASKRLQWYMSSENEPYATLTSAGKLTAKKVVSKNRIIVYADIDGKPGFMRVVDIYPAVTQVDVMWEDDIPINGKTIPVDFTTENLLFTVTAHPLDTMQNVTWSISDSEKQTYAEYETNGRVLRVFNLKRTKAGTVTVKATVNAGQKKSVSFKLQFGSFAKEVNISAAADYLQSGNSLQLSAATVPAKPTKSGITWSLSKEDKAYASISSSGLLKAKTVYGRTEITVIATSKDGHAQAEFPVTILPANSAILLLKCGEENVTKRTVYVDLNGDPTITLTAERFDKLAQPSVTWSVPKSAEVLEKTDTSLTLRFLKAGTATITATGADKQKATVKVVAAKMAQSVEISQKKTNLTEGFEVASGKTLELKATVENAKNKKVTWSLAPGDKDFAKISSSGKLTASKNLTTMRQVTVTATAADGSGISDVAVVTIRPIAQGVQIYSVVDGVRTFSVRSNPNRWVRSNTVYEWDMVASNRLTLSSHVYPYYTEDHPRNAIQGVTWKSSSTKVASIDANGNVTCHKPGTTTITATAKDGSNKKVTFKLTVVKKTTGLQLPDQQVIGGKTLALNKLVQYSPTDVTNKTLKWEITGGTGTAYATLSSKGSLKTKKVTKPVTVTVRITATDGTPYTDTCTVTILPKS